MSRLPQASPRAVIAGALALAAAGGIAIVLGPRAPAEHPSAVFAVTEPPATTPDAAPPPADASPPPSPWMESRGALEPDEVLSTALQSQGATPAQVSEIVTALRGIYDFRGARPGDAYTLRLRRTDQRLEYFRFEHGPLDHFEVVRGDGDALIGRRVEIPVRLVEAEVGAEIRSSLYAAMQRAGESPALVALIVDVFAWDLDFYKDPRPGDRFRVVVEKVYKDDQFIKYGRVLAAEYSGKAGTFRCFWFAPEGGPAGYFLEDGRSAKKTFLRTPLKYVRVSSGFSRSRKHPILGYNKAHLGVDYAARRGTPVWAMAAGRVTFAGRKGPNGNLVVINHGGGLRSMYAHLHRIRRGIKRGVRVDQKRIIGTVGSTGRSTGPHLHFAVKRNGRYVNPRRLKMTRSNPVPRKLKKAFRAVVSRRVERLSTVRVAPAPIVEPTDEGSSAVTGSF